MTTAMPPAPHDLAHGRHTECQCAACGEWVFTFPLSTGPRLNRRYVRCIGTAAEARAEMRRMFGDYAFMYRADEAQRLEAIYGYRELMLPVAEETA